MRRLGDGAIATRAFRELVAHVGAFYITERSMRNAQRRIEAALAAGDVDERTKNEYLACVKKYFAGFQSEARAHLRSVDKRLEHVNQVHFNLSAERGAAVKRIEATQQVLQDVDRVAGA